MSAFTDTLAGLLRNSATAFAFQFKIGSDGVSGSPIEPNSSVLVALLIPNSGDISKATIFMAYKAPGDPVSKVLTFVPGKLGIEVGVGTGLPVDFGGRVNGFDVTKFLLFGNSRGGGIFGNPNHITSTDSLNAGLLYAIPGSQLLIQRLVLALKGAQVAIGVGASTGVLAPEAGMAEVLDLATLAVIQGTTLYAGIATRGSLNYSDNTTMIAYPDGSKLIWDGQFFIVKDVTGRETVYTPAQLFTSVENTLFPVGHPSELGRFYNPASDPGMYRLDPDNIRQRPYWYLNQTLYGVLIASANMQFDSGGYVSFTGNNAYAAALNIKQDEKLYLGELSTAYYAFKTEFAQGKARGLTDDQAGALAFDAYQKDSGFLTTYLTAAFSSFNQGRVAQGQTELTAQELTAFGLLFRSGLNSGMSISDATAAAAELFQPGRANDLNVALGRASQLSGVASGGITLTQLVGSLTDAMGIAKATGNTLGVLLTTTVLGIVKTMQANAQGPWSASAAALQATGLTFSQLVGLIGHGDLAAFGAVIGDVGKLIQTTQGNSAALQAGAGVGLVGSSLIAVGNQQGNKGLVLAGTLLSGVGGLVKGFGGGTISDAAQGGAALGGSIASIIGTLTGNADISALGSAISQAPGAIASFLTPGGTNAGITSAIGLVSGLVSQLVGGDAGRIIGGVGSLAQTSFQLANGAISSGNAAVAVAQAIAQIAGIKLNPATNYFLSLAAAAINFTNPVGWALFGVQTLFNLFNMGSFSKTALLGKNLDLDGNGINADTAYIRDQFYRGFFGGVSFTGSRILYDVNGTDIRLLKSVDYSMKAETTEHNVGLIGGYRSQYYTLYDYDTGKNLGSGTLKYNSASRSNVFVSNSNPLIQYSLTSDPDNSILTASIPTGRYLVDVSATYSPINPSVGPATGRTQIILTDLAARNAFVQQMGNSAVTTVDASYSDGDGGWYAQTNVVATNANEIATYTGEIVSGTLDHADTRVDRLATALQQITTQFTGNKNDPNLYIYADMNGDGVPDLIRVGLTGNQVKVQGDGKVAVTLMDANRNPLAPTFTASSFQDAQEMAVFGQALLAWGASRPQIWNAGRDIATFYNAAKAQGLIPLFTEAFNLQQTISSAFLSGNLTFDSLSSFTRLAQLQDALKITFDPNAYASSNSDVANAFGTNIYQIIQHYINNGNGEGRVINTAGERLPIASAAGVLNIYDSTGRIIQQSGIYAGGIRRTQNFDVNNQNWWSTYTDIINAAGVQVEQTGTQRADGVTWDTFNVNGVWVSRAYNDVQNRYDWSTRTDYTLADGAIYQTNTYLDTGSSTVQHNDVAGSPWGGNQWWSTYTDIINAAGVQVEQTGTQRADGVTWDTFNVNGVWVSRSLTDSQNRYAWATIQRNLDANGSVTSEFVTTDGGQVINFDAWEYMAANPDVAVWAGNDPVVAEQHYIQYGIGEGRATSGFDVWSYMAANADMGIDPLWALRHYVEHGKVEGRGTSFNAQWYLAANPNLGTDPVAAVQHYVLYGRAEGRVTSRTADWSDDTALAYLASYPDDLASAGVNPQFARDHYNAYGYYEGRSVSFNTTYYADANPDLRGASAHDLLVHYLTYGRNEGRFTSRTADWTDDTALAYLASYPGDLAGAGANPQFARDHYNAYGYYEGRSVSFNPAYYAEANPDLAGASAHYLLVHFLQYGQYEGRGFSHTNVDTANTQWWSSYTDFFDTNNRFVSQTGTDDTGEQWQWTWQSGYGNVGPSQRIDWDTAGATPWWHQIQDFDATGQLSRFETAFDDGTKSIDSFSNDVAAGWTKHTQLFNATGGLTSDTYVR